MATAKKEEENLYDLGDVPSTENSAPARIDKPGITHNLRIACALTSGNYKNEDAKVKSADGKWHGFEVTLTDPDGLQFTELYFMPPTKVEDVVFNQQKWELVDGKNTNTRETTPAESLKILNNEFLAFLMDIGEAMGYKNSEVKEHLYKNAKGFIPLAQAFIDRFKPSETTRVSAKILYNNNKNKRTSFLKLHGPYTTYYPFGNDLLDIYVDGRKTILKLTDWELKTGMVKLYTGEGDAPAGGNAINTEGGFKPSVSSDEDPF